MKTWDSLYKEKGIVQPEVSGFVKDAVEFFEEQRLTKILDHGCGTGRHTSFLLEHGFKVWGCEISENALKIVKEMIKEVEFKKCDMTFLPYENNFFDGVLSHFVINHGKIADIRKAISEIYRVLRDKGMLFLAVPSIKHQESHTGEEIEPNTKINIDSIDGDLPHHYFIEEEIKELFDDFEILSLKHITYQNQKDLTKKGAAYILYARK